MTQCVLWISILVTGSFISLSQSKLRHPSVIPKGEYVRKEKIHDCYLSLKEYLFEDYSVLTPPVQNLSQKLNVYYDQKLKQLVHVNIQAQQAHIYLSLRYLWYDQFLIWDPKDFCGITTLQVPIGEIWMPDIIVDNSPENHEPVAQESLIKPIVDYTGRIAFLYPLQTIIPCNMFIKLFPFDIMICTCVVAQPTRNKHVRVSHIKIGNDSALQHSHPEWHFQKKYEVESLSKNSITFSYTFNRNYYFILYTLILPTILTTILGSVVFFLPSASGEKMGFLVTILLALAVNLNVIVKHIPISGVDFPLLGMYFFSCMVIVGVCTVISSFILGMNFVDTDNIRPVPKWAKLIFFNFFSDILGCEKMSLCHYSFRNEINFDGPKSCIGLRKTFSYFRKICIQLFRLCRCQKEPAAPEELPMETLKSVPDDDEKATVEFLENILNLLQSYKDKFEEEDIDSKLIDEWQRLARIFDRLCLIIYVIFLSAITIYFFITVTSSAQYQDDIAKLINDTLTNVTQV